MYSKALIKYHCSSCTHLHVIPVQEGANDVLYMVAL